MKNIISTRILSKILWCIVLSGLIACQQEDSIPQEALNSNVIEYSDDIYTLKQYKAERHPPVCRNGMGMDIYHFGNSSCDTLYFDYESLPAWHPNNLTSTGVSTIRCDSVEFQYDLLFYNEFAYTLLSTGDYSPIGFPAIFLYTDPTDDSKSSKAVMVGQGINCFNAFTADSVTAERIAGLSGDALVNLANYRTEVHTATIDGKIMLYDEIGAYYHTLTIGNKFRPNIGGIFDMDDVSDVAQINYQPVFLIRTREGLYAKFMVTRFKGVGQDVQKMSLQWQALKVNS